MDTKNKTPLQSARAALARCTQWLTTGLLATALCMAAGSAAAQSGSLSGASSASTTAVDLATQGSADWAHWGTGGVPGLVRKSSGSSQISDYSAVGGASATAYNDDPRPLSWSAGTPTASASNDTTGIYISGQGNGFSVTVPADTSSRTVKVYVGGWNSSGSFSASLSDGSATDYTDTTSVASGQYDRSYTVTYRAGSASQHLTLKWVQAGANGNVTLNAVALGLTPALLPSPPSSPVPVANYEYDAQGNPTKTVQAPGVSGFGFATQSSYDTLNRQKNSTDAKSGITQFGYNGREDLTQVTDPRSLVTQYPRNGLGDVTGLVSPDTGTATQTVDAAGNLLTRTDSRGVLASYSYDALNRLSGIVYTQSGQTTQSFGWTYDQTGTGFSNGIGRLTSTTHPWGSTQYAYDPQGRLLTDVQTVNAASGANPSAVATTVSYGYDAAGHVTSIVYPSGRVLTVTYTGGQPSAIALAKDGTSTATTLIDQLAFAPFGGVLSWNWQLASGAQAHGRVYDTSGRLVRYRLGNVARDLSFDAADRITAYTHYDATTGSSSAALDQAFAYDELGRLTGITTATASWSIGYDANGNRTGVTLNGSTSAYTTSTTSNRLASITNPARSFGYDSAGNTTSDSASYTSTYSLAGRLATLTKGGVTGTYAYDGMGRRVRKFTSAGSGSTVIFVYDQQGQLLGEYDSTGKAIREYVWLGSTPIAMFTPDTVTTNPPLVYFVHADHLDTPRVVVDKNNAVRWRWMAEPFGTSAPETDPQSLGALNQPLRFPGQYADSETGLSYNFFRDFDSSTGRYVQSDPIGLKGGVNTYAYVNGNPLRYMDPLGLYTEVVYWHGVGKWESQFGHISTNINGKNYSWGPPGQWDTVYPTADAFNQRQQTFRDGNGVILNLSPAQEKALAACMGGSGGKYNFASNNCGTSVQDCLQKVGVQFDKALRPTAIFDNLSGSPSAVGSTFYPGPPRTGAPLDNPFIWGF